MRIVTSLLFFFCACGRAPAAPSRTTAAPGPTEAVRVIPACVVNDATAPVPEPLIREALAALSDSYRAEVGITLDVRPTIVSAFKPSGWPMDTAFALAKICPGEDELRFVFSDREVHRADASMTKAEDDAQMAGDAHPYYGFIIVYSARERWQARNRGGGRALIGTLKHELGHVFGLDDSQDRTSFMYFASNGSLGRWTEDAHKTIRANKWRRWWPRS